MSVNSGRVRTTRRGFQVLLRVIDDDNMDKRDSVIHQFRLMTLAGTTNSIAWNDRRYMLESVPIGLTEKVTFVSA